LLLLLLVAGGTMTSGSPSSPVASPNGHVDADVDRLRRLPPIHLAIYHRPVEDKTIDRAEAQLIAGCMARNGVRYEPEPSPTFGGDEVLLRPFGVEAAAEPRPATLDVPEQTNAEPDRYWRALYGDPAKRMEARGETLTVSIPAIGCQAEAERRLQGDQRVRALELRIRLFEAEALALDLLERDEPFTAAREAWRECIRAAGVNAADPVELLDTLPSEMDLGQDPLVRADLACKDRTGLLAIGYTRLAALQYQVLAGRPNLLTEWDTLRQQQVRAARAVLG
jgi:hypothetical protein